MIQGRTAPHVCSSKEEYGLAMVFDQLQVDRAGHQPDCKRLRSRMENPIDRNDTEGYTTTRERSRRRTRT
jgi:hypothetical protein